MGKEAGISTKLRERLAETADAEDDTVHLADKELDRNVQGSFAGWGRPLADRWNLVGSMRLLRKKQDG